MLASVTQRFLLTFSTQKSLAPEVEDAAVFAVAEINRNKRDRLIARQSGEKLISLSKVGYPLWLFPRKEVIFVFDGFSDSYYGVSYAEAPSAKVFRENLEASLRPKEKYMAFLSDHINYFNQPTKIKQFMLRGLITDPNFKKEFNNYRKETEKAAEQTTEAFLLPTLEETTISSILTEFDNLQSFLKEDAEMLHECIKLVNKMTNQYLTELDYEATAVKEETEAKIRAQEELVIPKIAKLNKEYTNKIKKLNASFDKEIQSHQKLKTKTQRFIEDNERKIKLYQSEAKVQATKMHVIYEKRLKIKVKHTKKEQNGLKKELKNIKENLMKLDNQKIQEISKLNFDLDAEIKLTRQPLLELQASLEVKMLDFKKEKDKLLKQEKAVIEGLNKSSKLREATKFNFEILSIGNQGLKSQALFYIPFYLACYESNITKRYLVIPPSTISGVDFSTKFKGIFGISKIKNLLVPRFKTFTALIKNVQELAKQNSVFASQLDALSQRSNLLNNCLFLERVEKGLVYLKDEGWLSDKETQLLSRCIKG